MLLLILMYLPYILAFIAVVALGVFMARKNIIRVYAHKKDIYIHLAVPVVIVLLMLCIQITFHKYLDEKVCWNIRNALLLLWLFASFIFSVITNKSLLKGFLAWITKTLLTFAVDCAL